MSYHGGMRRWLIFCLLALAAMLTAPGAAPAFAEPSDPAGAATSADQPPTTIQASASRSIFRYGDVSAVTISGIISVPGASLTLEQRSSPDASWSDVVTTTTAGPDGRFAFAALPAPPVTTDYRVSYSDDEQQHEPASVSITVSVRPRITLNAPATVWIAPGGTVRLTGSVQPAHSGGEIVIDRRNRDGSWVQVGAAAALDADSRFSLNWTSDRYGPITVRARMPEDADHAQGSSPKRALTINLKNAHKVPYQYKHYIVNVVHEYKLYYYERGTLVRSFRVALGRPGYPTPLGTYKIYHKRRPGGGALGSCVMFYRQARGIAIHGTNQPGLLSRFPRPFSHGCSRMYNKEALWLYYRCNVGTPVKNLR